MFKKIAFIVVLLVLFTKPLRAADKDVVCRIDGCSGFSGSLFSEVNMLPGDSVSKTFSIKNERSEEVSAKLESEENDDTDEIFKQKVVVVVYEGGSDILFSGTFENFLGIEIDLGNLGQNQTKNYEVSASFPSDAGNVYQEKQINFDLILMITGEDSGTTDVLSSTTSTSSSSDSNKSGDILGEILGLSDTGGIMKVVLLLTSGLTLTSIGIRLSKKR